MSYTGNDTNIRNFIYRMMLPVVTLVFLLGLECVVQVADAYQFVGVAARCGTRLRKPLRMALDPILTKSFPRDFKNIPLGTDYGAEGSSDSLLNRAVESRKLSFLEGELMASLKDAVRTKQRPMFTTALIGMYFLVFVAIGVCIRSSSTMIIY